MPVAPLHGLPKLRHEFAVPDRRPGITGPGSDDPQNVGEQRAQETAHGGVASECRSAELAEQEGPDLGDIRGIELGTRKRHGRRPLQRLRVRARGGAGEGARQPRGEGDHQAGGVFLEVERVHRSRGHHHDGGSLQDVPVIIEPQVDPPAVDHQQLVQLLMAVRGDGPVVQSAARGDRLDVHRSLLGRPRRVSVKEEGRDRRRFPSTPAV